MMHFVQLGAIFFHLEGWITVRIVDHSPHRGLQSASWIIAHIGSQSASDLIPFEIATWIFKMPTASGLLGYILRNKLVYILCFFALVSKDSRWSSFELADDGSFIQLVTLYN